jgi:hypothetical protein
VEEDPRGGEGERDVTYREPALLEAIASDWDIVAQGPPSQEEYRIVFRLENGWLSVTSAIVNAQGLPERSLDVVTCFGPGSHVRVRSGKVYVLTGPRWSEHDLALSSVMDPASWYYKRSEMRWPWWKRLLVGMKCLTQDADYRAKRELYERLDKLMDKLESESKAVG